MARLIVRNSSLAYPPVPDEVLSDGDTILPLVDRFEDAAFMAGPGYDRLRELFPEFNLQTRASAREIGDFLPAWLGDAPPQWGHSAWEAYSDHFAKFSLGPILVNDFLARVAIEAGPDEVLGWELEHTEGWWAGRQMVADVARVIGDALDVPVELSAPAIKRTFRDSVLPVVRKLQALQSFRRRRSLDFPRPERGADILFVVSGPTVVPMLDRIGARIEEEHGLTVIGLDTPQGEAPDAILAGDLPRWSLYSFMEPWMIRAGIGEALMAAEQFAETVERLREWEVFLRLPPQLQDVFVRRLYGTMVSDLPGALFHARLWHAALSAIEPRALVAFNSYNEVLAPGALQAGQRDIPTLCLQHGIWGPLLRTAALLPYDEILIFGDYAHEMLRPLAYRHTQFVQTGHCLYDELDLTADVEGVREALLGQHEHLVVVTTQPIERRLMVNEPRWWLRGLAEAAARCNAALAIKPHPQEPADLLARHSALAEQMPETVRVVPHGDVPLKDLIAAADLLVTRFSTTAFEAALLDTPVMTVNLSGGPDQYPFAEEGGAVGVYEYDQIEPTLSSLLTDKELRDAQAKRRATFLARHLGPRDGRATERIAERIAARAQHQ